MATPKNATAFTMDVTFFKNGAVVASPPLAIGDVKVTTAGGVEGNIVTLPTVKTYGAEMTLSAAEMTGGRTKVLFRDPDGAWDDLTITLNYDTRNVDDVATQASVDVIDDFLDTEIAAIKAKTDGLPADPADASDLLALHALLDADLDALLTRLTALRAANLDSLDAAVSSRSTYGGGDTGGTTTLLARLTAIRAALLDNLDAAISSRSTYAGADTAGTTTLLTRNNALDAAGTGAAVLAAATATPIAADVKKINAVTITGAGVSGNEFQP